MRQQPGYDRGAGFRRGNGTAGCFEALAEAPPARRPRPAETYGECHRGRISISAESAAAGGRPRRATARPADPKISWHEKCYSPKSPLRSASPRNRRSSCGCKPELVAGPGNWRSSSVEPHFLERGIEGTLPIGLPRGSPKRQMLTLPPGHATTVRAPTEASVPGLSGNQVDRSAEATMPQDPKRNASKGTHRSTSVTRHDWYEAIPFRRLFEPSATLARVWHRRRG